MAADTEKPLKQKDLVCLKLVRAVLPFCASLTPAANDVHGNARLSFSDTLLVLKPHLVSLPPWEYVTPPLWTGTETRPVTPF